MRRFKPPEHAKSSATWLISFTDVMALMLTFFVLIFSMSVPEEVEWQGIASSMQQEFGKNYNDSQRPGPSEGVDIKKLLFSQAEPIAYLEAIIREEVSQNEDLSEILTFVREDHLVLSLPSDLLFQSGQSEVEEKGRRVLYSLSDVLAKFKNAVEITGHTDPTPVAANSLYSSNWGLSMARAASVAAILQKVGYNRNIVIRGHSSGRYKDLGGALSETERQDLARRVDIVIMDNDGTIRLNSVNTVLK